MANGSSLNKGIMVAQKCYVKKVFLEISQNSQKNTCAKVSFLMKFKNTCVESLL